MSVVSFSVDASDGAARAGRVSTPRGEFLTPAFMPVATRGTIRALATHELDQLAPPVVLANTYHLMMRPGAEVVEALGGLHEFMGWPGHTLTDSGGFQVMSLKPKIFDDGVVFQSTYDGAYTRFTPADAMRVQMQLGADIAMALDVCPPLPSAPAVVDRAIRLTKDWARRCRDAHAHPTQALFGIVQGGVDVDLRAQCAADIATIGFDGHAIGGLSVGEPRSEMLPALDAAIAELPSQRPRYLMGVGDPISLVEGIARGVDMFDCVLPTRLARHGTALTHDGRVQLKNAAFRTATGPIDAGCGCVVCNRYSAGYVRHLLTVGEVSGGALLTIHNVAFLLDLVARARAAIASGTLAALVADVRRVWDDGRG